MALFLEKYASQSYLSLIFTRDLHFSRPSQTFPRYPIGGTKKSVFTADFMALAVKVAINVYFVWCDGRVA